VQLFDLFDASFTAGHGEVAVEFDAGTGRCEEVTFGQLASRANRMARVLTDRGLRRGDRLGIYLPNSLTFVDLFLACVKLGVIFVPINVLYREREIAHILDDAEPAAIVGGPSSRSVVRKETAFWDVDALAQAASAGPDDPVRMTIDGTEPAVLIYTSGTTGRSKGAILSHDNLLANAANLITCWRITAADRYLAVLPLFHVHGLGNGLVCALAAGCRTRLVDRFDAARMADQFASFRPTLFFGVPTIYVRLLELPEAAARAIGRDVRLFVSGSAPLPAAVFDEFRDRFGHAILERYGMSETLMNISNPYAGERRPGTVGLPLPGVQTRIVDADVRDVEPGTIGELLVRGPNVFSGYWRNPAATAAAFVDGWFRTGDLAERSADGYFTLRGRRTDLIISGGFNIYPREIEELLVERCGVREAAVVGVDDPRRGEVPLAYVVADGPIDSAALEAACRQALASFKVPRGFVQLDALPRNALGKVQKHLLPGIKAELRIKN
jgi:malonyl-CoA/methylmalonyl-CoA synthetase